MSTAPRPLYLDCDTGVDDALTLAYLLNHPGVALQGIGTVAGNTTARQGAANTAALLALAGRCDIPVAIGESAPREGGYRGGAPHVHGINGIGDVELAEGAPASTEHAVAMLIRLAEAHPGALDVVAVGPLTNIARALELRPDLPQLIRTLTIMGGAVRSPGNITPYAEANIRNDPEAARIVLGAGLEPTLVPLDVTLQHTFGDDDVRALHSTGSALHVALAEMLEPYLGFYERAGGARRAPLHDPLAAAIAAEEVAPTQTLAVPLTVVLEGEERGRTVVDEAAPSAPVRVVTAADGAAASLVRARILASSGPLQA